MKVEWISIFESVKELRREDRVVLARCIRMGSRIVGFVYNARPVPHMKMVCSKSCQDWAEAQTWCADQFLPSNSQDVA